MITFRHARVPLRGPVPRIHVLLSSMGDKDVDGRNKSSHDGSLHSHHFSPTLNGGSLPGGTVSSAIARSIATIT